MSMMRLYAKKKHKDWDAKERMNCLRKKKSACPPGSRAGVIKRKVNGLDAMQEIYARKHNLRVEQRDKE